MSEPFLQFDGIDKAFQGVQVLKGITFSVLEGSMVGLVGENGAGKSTLMNILGGNVQPDAGRIRFAGKEYLPRDPQDAAAHQIAFIHQELNLFPNLSIAENIFLTRFPRIGSTPFIQRSEINRRAAELLCEVGLELPPRRLVETLSAGERQLVEIAKALSIDARLIIFDEPTTSLTERETARLFELITRLRARGLTIIYISHTLRDVFRHCDHIVVLRDGQVLGSAPTDTFTTERLVSLMVGRPMSQLFPDRGAKAPPENTNASANAAAALLEVRGLSRPGFLENISFTCREGEVLGLAGLMGAGRSELARALFGLDGGVQGEVWFKGELLRDASPRERIRRGMAFLTENRHSEGLCLEAAVSDNLSLAALPEYGSSRLRWLARGPLHDAITRIRDKVNLDSRVADQQPVRTLSGGNQQKVVLGKWLLRPPHLLMLDEPTRGIDVGARFEIYRLIHQLADNGTGIFVISSEMEELIGLCDRILVMRSGKLVDDLPRVEFDRERILRAALGNPQEVSS